MLFHNNEQMEENKALNESQSEIQKTKEIKVVGKVMQQKLYEVN